MVQLIMSNFKLELVSGKISKNTKEAGWYDLYANEDCKIYPGIVCMIPTGVRTILSPGLRAKCEEKSGIGLSGISIRSGCIDSDYRGEWNVLAQFHMPLQYFFDVEQQKGISSIELMTKKQAVNAKFIKDLGYIPIAKGTAICAFKLEVIPEVSILTTMGESEYLDAGFTRGEGGFGSTTESIKLFEYIKDMQNRKIDIFADDVRLDQLCGDREFTFVLTAGGMFQGTLQKFRKTYKENRIIENIF